MWFVYVARTAFLKDENGIAYKNYLSLEKLVGSYPTFCDAYNKCMLSIRKDILKENRGIEGCKSRSGNYCVDYYSIPVPKEFPSKEKDCFVPGTLGIEVIATTFSLSLVECSDEQTKTSRV